MLETGLASSKLKENCTEPNILIFDEPINSVHTTSINKQVQPRPPKEEVLCCSSQALLREPEMSMR